MQQMNHDRIRFSDPMDSTVNRRTEADMADRKKMFFSCLLTLVFLVLAVAGTAQDPPFENGDTTGFPASEFPASLKRAVMCERIQGYEPVNPTIILPVPIGQAICFTEFDPVSENTFIYHQWFHRDKLITKINLKLKPPRWATFSRIYIREDDKGPWRVEVTDPAGTLLQTLRFSITD